MPARLTSKRWRALGRWRDRTDSKQEALYRISEATHAVQELADLFSKIHGIIGRLMPVSNFYVALYDQETQEVTYPYYVDETDPCPEPRKLGLGLTDYVIRTGKSLLLSTEAMQSLVQEGSLRIRGTPPIDWLGVPLVASGGLIGILAVETYSQAVRYTAKDKALLEYVSRQVASAIERTRSAQELARAYAALREQSLTDPLTGLRNRRFLDVCIPDDIAQMNRLQRSVLAENLDRVRVNIHVLFVIVDLDFFKAVNDGHGHAAGDRVLRQISAILRTAVRETDTLVRWGGEEFLVVARNTARADAQTLPERIRSAVAAHPFDIGEASPLHCTCSIGFCLFPMVALETDRLAWEQSIDLADQCLFAAKRNGRNAWVGVAPDPREFVPPQPGEGARRARNYPVLSSLAGGVLWGEN